MRNRGPGHKTYAAVGDMLMRLRVRKRPSSVLVGGMTLLGVTPVAAAPQVPVVRAGIEEVRPLPRQFSEFHSAVDAVHANGNGLSEAAMLLARLPEKVIRDLERDGISLLDPKKVDLILPVDHLHAVVRFNRVKPEVFDLLAQPARVDEILPRIRSTRVLRRQGDGELTQFRVRVPARTIEYRVQHWFYPEYSRVEWALDATLESPLKELEGYWQLYADDDGSTIGVYGSRVETGGILPGFLRDFFIKNDLPENMAAFRRWVGDGGLPPA